MEKLSEINTPLLLLKTMHKMFSTPIYTISYRAYLGILNLTTNYTEITFF